MANTIELVKIIAMEGLLNLRNQIVMPFTCHKGYEDKVCEQGDTIKIPKPYNFVSNPMNVTTGVTPQDITDEMIEFKVDQWEEVTAKMNDLEATVQNRVKLKDLIRDMSIPIVEKIETTGINQLLYNTVSPNNVSGITNGLLDPPKIVDVNTRQFMNKVPIADQRNMFSLVSGLDRGALLKTEQFTNAQWVPDGGEALKTAMLLQRYGYTFYPSQLTSAPTITDASGAVNNVAGYTAGTKTLVVDGFTAAPPEGAILVFANHATPYTIDAGSTTTSLKLKNGLTQTVADDVAITILDVNQNAFYHRNAIAFAMAKMKSSDGQYPGSIVETATDPVSGLSIRAEYWRDGAKKTNYLTLDALWGWKHLDERLSYKYYTKAA